MKKQNKEIFKRMIDSINGELNSYDGGRFSVLCLENIDSLSGDVVHIRITDYKTYRMSTKPFEFRTRRCVIDGEQEIRFDLDIMDWISTYIADAEMGKINKTISHINRRRMNGEKV